MNILLFDVDSKIPNLALMKLSAYHKEIGDQVGLIARHNKNSYEWKTKSFTPDLVYFSTIYRRNRGKTLSLASMYNDTNVLIGGPGFDLESELLHDIEMLKPDYDLYPSAYSMGFTTRGCIRNCHFCIVPQKEGQITRWQHPKDFHDDRFNTIMLLDNNWLAIPDWFFETSWWIIRNKLKVWEHGLDIRLVDEEIARRLLKIKMVKGYHFAFDFLNLEPIIKEKIQLLKDMGFNLRQYVQFYVYVHSDSDQEFESALYRARLLKELGTNAFIMFNMDADRSARMKALQRWCNRKQLFWSIDFTQYNYGGFNGETTLNKQGPS